MGGVLRTAEMTAPWLVARIFLSQAACCRPRSGAATGRQQRRQAPETPPVPDVRLQAALEAGQGAICDRWSRCSSTTPRTSWLRRWRASAGPSWRATREFYRTARDAEKHSPGSIAEAAHQLTAPTAAIQEEKTALERVRWTAFCDQIQRRGRIRLSGSWPVPPPGVFDGDPNVTPHLRLPG